MGRLNIKGKQISFFHMQKLMRPGVMRHGSKDSIWPPRFPEIDFFCSTLRQADAFRQADEPEDNSSASGMSRRFARML